GDTGVFGAEDIPTPFIDQLAAEGVTCTTSYITNPPCCPSRCTLIMGQYGQRFGKYGMSRGLSIPEDRPTLAKFLTDNGYITGQVGKWDIGNKQQGPLQVGFTEVAKRPPLKVYTEEEIAQLPPNVAKVVTAADGKSQYFVVDEEGKSVWMTEYDGDAMVNFIERHKKEPFFLYWSPLAVHSKHIEAPESLTSRTTAPDGRKKLAGGIVSVDDQVGKLLATLDKHGLRENTLVIFSSDNGANETEGGTSSPYTGGKGSGTQKEGWVRVPSILSMPGTLPKGARYEGMMANWDFYSTIATLTCQTIPEHCDGKDIFPWLTGEKQGDVHEYLFWQNSEPGDAERRHLIAARWKNWRLYRKYDEDPWQLFNLKKDPTESKDVAADNPAIVEKLSTKHSEWLAKMPPVREIEPVTTKKGQLPKGYGWAKAK
ncbi:MAG: sulfatase-like hydrolase/transferase, partial [Verrucomicrobiota bacterium]